ncbi:MAG: hypothetical protein BZ136_09460 [Methanosphaera sp. rholeuAM74]|nr:MAG: hypothetical protein BZ136_09460 [Methanosphaera sp. rholeuAM74]
MQINITAIDAVNGLSIPNSIIEVTGDITTNTTSGILTDNLLTTGNYKIYVKFNETADYKTSNITIDFSVEIDKDKKIAEMEEQINSLNNTINNQTETINSLNDTVNQQANTIENLNNIINEQTNAINTLNNTVEEQTNTINNINNTIQEQTNTINSLNNTVNEQKDTINTLNDTVNSQATTIDLLNDTVNSQTSTIEGLNNKIDEQTTTIEGLNNTVNEQATTIDSLNNTVNSQATTIGLLNDTVNSQATTIEGLNNKIDEQAATISSLNDTVNTQASTIESLTSQVEQQSITINNLNIEIETQGNQIKQLTEIVKVLYDEIINLTSTINTTVTVNSISAVELNNDVTITGTLKDNDGNILGNSVVKVTVNGADEYAVTDNTGSYKYTTTTKNVGTNNVTVTYEGSSKYNPSTQATTFIVNKEKTIIIIDKIDNVAFNDNVTITGKYITANGIPLKNTTVKITINGITVGVKTDKNGVFTYTTQAKTMGTNNVSISFAGNSKYEGATNTTTFRVIKQDTLITINPIKTVAYNENVTITGTYKDANGNPLKNTTVKININGKTVGVKTDKNGVFTYTTQAKTMGTNNVSISFAGNTKFRGTVSYITFEVIKQKTEITINPIDSVIKGENVTISGAYKDADGNPIRNTMMKVYINAKRINVKTDSDGVFVCSYKTSTVGTNDVVVSFAGNTKFEGAITDATFKVLKA